MIRDGENGFLCQRGDIDEFASRLTRLAGDGVLRKKIAEGARKTASQVYSSDVVARQWIETVTGK